jgi:hypothetical protein
VIRSRKYSSSFAGGQPQVTWIQYVGIGTLDVTNLDPYGMFNRNPYSNGYQTLYNAKLCFKVVGATIFTTNKEGLKLFSYNDFDSLLNIVTNTVTEQSFQSSDGMHDPAPFRVPVDGNGVKTADQYTLNHLKDADGTDWTTCVQVGDTAYNLTDGTSAAVTAVAAHDLTLASNAFDNGNEIYLICRTSPNNIYWQVGKMDDAGAHYNTWSAVDYSPLFTESLVERSFVTSFTYDGTTNVLTKVTKPEGNEINLVYGAAWKSSYVVRDYEELDNNLNDGTDTSQFLTNEYDYDIRGRLIQRKTALTSQAGSLASYLWTDGGKYPQFMVEYEYDGMDRVVTKKIGNTSTNAVLKQTYDDTNRVATTIDFLGFKAKTWYDRFYRPIETKAFKPNQDTDFNFGNLVADPENLTTANWTT